MLKRIHTLSDLRCEIERLGTAGNRTLGRWTVGQIYYHLAAAFEASVDGLPPGYTQVVRCLIRPFRLLVTHIKFPPCLPIPHAIAKKLSPPADVDCEEQYKRLIHAVERFDKYDGPLPPHPVLGPLSRQQWIGFHLRHSQHHLSFIEKLK
jgi:hypothetical protein